MKRWFIYLLAIVGIALVASKTADRFKFRNLKNSNFATGERYKYLAHYSFLNAGEAVITMDNDIHTVNNRPCYKVDVEGKSIGTFGLFMTINDLWRSYVDTAAVTTHEFYRNIEEGKYKLEETTKFDHHAGKGKLKQVKGDHKEDEEFEFPEYPQDIISGYYYLRTIEYDNMEAGEIVKMNAVYEDTVYNFQIKYLGKEVVKTKFGKINAFAMSPIMPDNDLFDGGDSITFWVSDDENRVPLKIRAKMFVGAVEVELIEYSGTKGEFNFADSD
ncbi:DUF3108 domain-containing protein [Flammeovirgaceae bacterium SG7u.111]|nr:DUF3108 domain-containing protein [Flammeovirgaceae bacterium SG7u.132]WPO36861.1 DUF3108 domain-containing protein [Flammeovirgaceae bacterium SG7u.111]